MNFLLAVNLHPVVPQPLPTLTYIYKHSRFTANVVGMLNQLVYKGETPRVRMPPLETGLRMNILRWPGPVARTYITSPQ